VLREAVEEHHSLYEGTQGVALEDAAPYLVRLGADSRLLAQLVREGWARRWGIFTEGMSRSGICGATPALPHGGGRRREPLYFRFYDPGALRDFWPSCSRRQLTELVGPLRAFLVEGERARSCASRRPARSNHSKAGALPSNLGHEAASAGRSAGRDPCTAHGRSPGAGDDIFGDGRRHAGGSGRVRIMSLELDFESGERSLSARRFVIRRRSPRSSG